MGIENALNWYGTQVVYLFIHGQHFRNNRGKCAVKAKQMQAMNTILQKIYCIFSLTSSSFVVIVMIVDFFTPEMGPDNTIIFFFRLSYLSQHLWIEHKKLQLCIHPFPLNSQVKWNLGDNGATKRRHTHKVIAIATQTI